MAVAEKLKNAKVIFVMGGPGSGKSTQCSNMVSKYGLTHLSSGDLLRSEVALGLDSGMRLKRIMASGELVPLIDVLRLLGDAMHARALDSPGFLIDGYPRSSEQAIRFEAELSHCQAVLFLDVPEAVMKERILRRGRAGENDASVARQLELFRKYTKPVVDHYERLGRVIWVAGQGSAEHVFKRVQHGLMNFSVKPKRSHMLTREPATIASAPPKSVPVLAKAPAAKVATKSPAKVRRPLVKKAPAAASKAAAAAKATADSAAAAETAAAAAAVAEAAAAAEAAEAAAAATKGGRRRPGSPSGGMGASRERRAKSGAKSGAKTVAKSVAKSARVPTRSPPARRRGLSPSTAAAAVVVAVRPKKSPQHGCQERGGNRRRL